MMPPGSVIRSAGVSASPSPSGLVGGIVIGSSVVTTRAAVRWAIGAQGRTLTSLYNAPPTWLDHLHKSLDAVVAGAYGLEADLSNEEVLVALLKLNHERAAEECTGSSTGMLL